MFPSGQWSFNPSAYQNIPCEQVDWASLAQQWIKMKETLPIVNQEPAPPPAPQISKPINPPAIPTPARTPPDDIEGGEAPMDMDTKEDDNPGSVGSNSSGNWNQWGNWQNQWGWGWSGNAGTVHSADKTSSTSSTVDSKVKSPTNDSNAVLNKYVSNVGNFPVIDNAAACKSQVPGSFNYNNRAGGMISPTLRKSGVWNTSSVSSDIVKSHSETWSKGSRSSNRQSQKSTAVEQYPVIDAAKKKQLPAWIREGLNKMEREKQKKLEQERTIQEQLMRNKTFFDENSSGDEDSSVINDPPSSNIPITDELTKIIPAFPSVAYPQPNLSSEPNSSHSRTSRMKKDDNSLIRKTKDEIMEESMLKVRRILTEILLEVTENQVLLIAKEEFKRARSSASAQAVRKNNTLSSLSGNLGLNIYDSDDSDSSGSERINIDRRLDSDEELKLLIDRKKRDFQRIEKEIENEIEGQEAKEKLIARRDENNENSDSSDDEKSKVFADRSRETSHRDTHTKNDDYPNEDTRVTHKRVGGSVEVEERHQYNQHHSGVSRSTNHLNGNRKNEKVESKREKSSSSSTSTSDSESESSSETSSSSKSKSSHSSSSKSDSSASSNSGSDKNRSKRKRKASRVSRKSSKRRRHRSRSRSVSKEYKSLDSHGYNSRNRRIESYSRKRSSPRRRRSRSNRRSSSRCKELSKSKYSESSKRYEAESKQHRRRSSSNESRRSRYKRR